MRLKDQPKWQGKSWCTLGDSISAAGGYQPLVSTALGFSTVLNEGKSGCPLTAGGDRDYGATVHVGRQMEPVYDCVTIFSGTNDFRLDKPIGRKEERDIHTFYGAYVTLVEDILSKNPACRLNLWTPLQRDKDGFDIDSVNAEGHRLADYVEVIQAIGVEYALPVLNLYAESGFNRFTLGFLSSDRLHPNQEGFKRIAAMAIPFLERI
ncbi:SGNH/GDSL hydrolase family protein [Paenibacillus sp. CGMCC 1.16610]|uniref:SGNH/GDSL hydrolase family protein n=1 Tax=Paenibacillus anseongense TaxID=2682845 RepID=A0ABW9U6C1_9BACL|nr:MULTISPECIES: SGNH/GDSL hydrolase family protein [Paenibacillus]MBA2940465.1 SGNH/GDSL hydrolase family protein [Paenibacillus sp. CGMCC 1.16610]MVQ35642.1 SGNH/GDSL hydrolase family protein [Paenibacillus anseongense]